MEMTLTNDQIFIHRGKALLVSFNPFLPNGPCHPYDLDESISNFRGGWCFFFFFFF